MIIMIYMLLLYIHYNRGIFFCVSESLKILLKIHSESKGYMYKIF